MTTALSDTQIAEGIAGVYGNVPQTWRFERTTVGGEFIEDLTDHFLGGEIQVDNTRAVRATARVRISWREADGNPVALFQILRIVEERVILGRTVEFPRGLWVLVGMEHTHHEGGHVESDLTLHDYTSALIYSTVDAVVTFDSGTSYLSAMESVLDDPGVPHDLVWQGEGDPPVLPVIIAFAPGTSLYEILRVLADGIHYEVPFPDATGTFVTRPIVDPAEEPVAVAYSDQVEPRMIIGDVARSGDVVDIGSIPNECVVQIDDPFRWQAPLVVSELGLPFNAFRDIAVETDGAHLWCSTADTAYRIRVSDGAVVTSWATPVSGARGITVEADGQYVWVSATNGNLYRCAATNGAVDYDITYTLSPALRIAIEPDGAHIWTIDNVFGFLCSRISTADGSTDAIRDYTANVEGGVLRGIACDPDGMHLWLVGGGENREAIRVLVSGSQAAQARWSVPDSGADGIAVESDGAHVWVQRRDTSVDPFETSAARCARDGVNDYGFVRWRNADPESRVSTVHRSVDVEVLRGESNPGTRAVLDQATASAIARVRLQRHASSWSKVQFATLPDPRRWLMETVLLDVPGAVETRVRVRSWSQPLEPGAPTTVQGTAVEPTEITLMEAKP